VSAAGEAEEEADAPPKRNAEKSAPTTRGYGIHPPDPASLDIADAERIVAFGRGAFSDAAIELVRQLAEKLGAAVAGTRPAADEGWLPFSRQVGLTGAVVRPRLYVAVGISGAPYHMVGVKEPETLVAINRDPDAPIFGSAGLGIVGDLHEVLPRLIEEIGQGRGLDEAAPRAGERDSG
jgi:electron transfer flavoprotein alpha subunit